MIETELARRLSVVLVGTRNPGNIGSAARAMVNMGLCRLKLVRPVAEWGEEARMMASGALDRMDPIQVHTSFDESVAGVQVLVGTTSGRERRTHQPVYTPRRIAPLLKRHARTQEVALLFGPENRGLTDLQLSRCRYLVTVPSNDAFPVLNLAQAVMVLAYEINTCGEADRDVQPDLVTHGQRERMFRHMERVLIRIGFLSSSNPDHVMKAIRRFLGRADLSERDVRILRGIFSQVEWYERQGDRLPADQVRKP
ncbi:MAG: RNA methyltransferase [Acidobacteriota bacterium]|nr:RNA methyltransferase [Acidobacteriota bacterium]